MNSNEDAEEDPCSNSLDDAEAVNAEKTEEAEREQEGMEEIEAMFANHNGSLQSVLNLSRLEKLRWRFKLYPTSSNMAIRLFNIINIHRAPCLPLDVLDFLIKQIQDEFPVSKQAYDFVEVFFHFLACTGCNTISTSMYDVQDVNNCASAW
jgi:hypothetical protein